jgi:hypothetical protein
MGGLPCQERLVASQVLGGHKAHVRRDPAACLQQHEISRNDLTGIDFDGEPAAHHLRGCSRLRNAAVARPAEYSWMVLMMPLMSRTTPMTSASLKSLIAAETTAAASRMQISGLRN